MKTHVQAVLQRPVDRAALVLLEQLEPLVDREALLLPVLERLVDPARERKGEREANTFASVVLMRIIYIFRLKR